MMKNIINVPQEDSSQTKIAVMAEKINNIESTINEVRDEIKEWRQLYVTKAEFQPVKQIVFGFVGLIVVAVIGAFLTLVIRG